MLIDRTLFRSICTIGDFRFHLQKKPDDIERKVNIPYGKYGKWNLLDVYYPKGTKKPLPVIINIHGGGYVYGTKELYQYYCMSLAQRGFTVVNFNYRLVPEIFFPEPVIETNKVMKWICSNANEFYININNVFMVGDSAGAQIASQYAAIVTNPEYASLFELTVPDFNLKAIALNCGMYEKFHEIKIPLPGLLQDYFGKDPLQHGEKINVLKYINSSFPPAFITSAVNDFLLPCAQPMFEQLKTKGIVCVCKIYGDGEEKKTASLQQNFGHVFHLDILSETARECNDAQCDFFKQYVH